MQDFDSAGGDVLILGGDAEASDFQVNFARTAGAGADDIDEAFILHRPSAGILWALVDGRAQDEIMIVINGTAHDLLG